MPRNLTIEESHEFLDRKPGWIALTTIGPDGYPHTVPLGYFRLGEDIVMGVRGNTRKLKNIQDNPKVSLLLESGKSRGDIKGLMVQGTATVHSEPSDALYFAREAAKLRGVPEQELPTEPRNWTLRISSGVSKGIDKSVVQSGRDFPYIRVGGGQ